MDYECKSSSNYSNLRVNAGVRLNRFGFEEIYRASKAVTTLETRPLDRLVPTKLCQRWW